jgi:kinesin family protein 2/24
VENIEKMKQKREERRTKMEEMKQQKLEREQENQVSIISFPIQKKALGKNVDVEFELLIDKNRLKEGLIQEH